MEDLLQMQIIDSCRLALPEGLKDLMSDISREVLRAQPNDILGFITDYLSCLLVTRENLHVACHVYSCTCGEISSEGLEEELRKLDIIEEDIDTIKNLVDKYFVAVTGGKHVSESMLVSKILNRTLVVMDQLPDILDSVRRVFMRAHIDRKIDLGNESSDFEDEDDVTRATHHTLKLYKQSKPIEDEFHRAAVRIQAAYRAYGVRRERKLKEGQAWEYAPKIIKRASLASGDSGSKVRFEPDESEVLAGETIDLEILAKAKSESIEVGEAPRKSSTVSDIINIEEYYKMSDTKKDASNIEEQEAKLKDTKLKFYPHSDIIAEVDEPKDGGNTEPEDSYLSPKRSYKTLDPNSADDGNSLNNFDDEDLNDREVQLQFHKLANVVDTEEGLEKDTDFGDRESV